MSRKPRRRWHEPGLRGGSAGIEKVFPHPMWRPEGLGGDVRPPWQQGQCVLN
jgi:hypothetical protein